MKYLILSLLVLFACSSKEPPKKRKLYMISSTTLTECDEGVVYYCGVRLLNCEGLLGKFDLYCGTNIMELSSDALK